MTIDKSVSATSAAAEGQVSPITFRLDPGSGVPTYLQLVQQVEQALRLGYLRLGDQLPRVKDVVGTLSINPNTVLKAYRELEHRGIAAGRPGQGTFIESEPATISLKDLTRLRRRLLSGWLQEALDAGLDEDGITALFASAAHELFRAGRERDDPPGRGAKEVVA